MAKYGILEEDTYNFNKTGFLMGQIGIIMVVTSSDRVKNSKLAQPGNREYVTVIVGVNSQGWAIPAFIIVQGKHHLSIWYKDSPLSSDWVVAVSNNGWTMNELGVDWIKHFDQHIKLRIKGVYRLLVFDGHNSHHSEEFEQYCKENNILTFCMSAHSSHLF